MSLTTLALPLIGSLLCLLAAWAATAEPARPLDDERGRTTILPELDRTLRNGDPR